jgi:hypothetical protein
VSLIDVEIRTTALIHGSYALVVRMNENIVVTNIERNKEVEEDFDSNGFQPGYIPTRNLPIWGKLEANPPTIDDNSDAPEGACIDKDPDIEKRIESHGS